MPEQPAAGTIYDLGYQHYSGARLGRPSVMRALAGFSYRTAFGTGRGQKAQVVPFIVAILVTAPMVVRIGIAGVTGQSQIINYAQHLDFVAFFLALFAAAQAPEVLVADRQSGALSLYLSRSLSALDYVLAKLFAFFGALLVLTLGPVLGMFAGKIFLSESPWQAFLDNYKVLTPMVGGTVLMALYLAAIGLAIAAFTSRRAYASAAVIGFFVLLPAFAGIAGQLATGSARRYMVLGNPFLVMNGFVGWLFDLQADSRFVVQAGLKPELYLYVMLGTCAVALTVLLLRYRKAEA